MKISILLPYKENFSPAYAGAVSLFINDTLKISKYKNNTTVFGNTDYRNKFKIKYVKVNKGANNWFFIVIFMKNELTMFLFFPLFFSLLSSERE